MCLMSSVVRLDKAEALRGARIDAGARVAERNADRPWEVTWVDPSLGVWTAEPVLEGRYSVTSFMTAQEVLDMACHEPSFDADRYREVCRLLDEAQEKMSEWGCGDE